MILRILRYNRSRSSSILSSVNFYAANNGTVKYQSTTTDQDGKKRRSTGKFLLKSTALVGAGVAGGLVWLYYDTENRQKLEQYVPQSKQLLDFIYGNVNNFIGGANNTPLAIQQSGSGGIRKSLVNEKQPSPIAKAPIESSKTSVEEGKLKLTKVVDLSPPPSALPLTKQEAKHIEIQPVDIHKDAPKMELKKSADEEKEEPDLDEAFKAVVIPPLKLADEKANTAKDAKLKTIRSYQAKAKALKEAVNSGVEQSDGEAVWQRVKSAESEVEKCARMDAAAEAEARAAINALNKVISESKADPKKAKSPTIRNAVETVKKLNARLDELNYLIEKESSQLRVFSQYRQLVDKGRQQWADELKAAFPNLPAKAKEGSLTEEELNAFIVHASMHIDQLKRQLAEYQSQEEQKIANAIEEQRRIDEKLSKLHLEIESRRIREDENLSLEEKVQEERKLWEAEVEAQLKKKALAHSEHMEKIIRTQKQLHDIENSQIVEEARTLERNKFGKQIDGAVNRLNEIEQALNSRAALDLENRRAKIVWTVCQSLYESLVGTVDDQQQQYATAPLKEVKFLQELAENDDFVQSVCNCFPERAVTAGVPTENGLKRRFDRVFTLAWRTAQIDDNGGGPLQYFLSWLQSLFVFQLSAASSPDALIEPDKYEPYQFLSLIHDFAERGDFANAIRVANLLRGEPAQIFRDWVADAMLHVEARFLAELLLSHAQVSSIRTTY